MLDELWSRCASAPGAALRAMAASILTMLLDLASAAYVMVLFKRFGEPGFRLFAAATTLGLLGLLVGRMIVARLRHRSLRLMLAGGPDGDVALARLAAEADPARRAGALAAARAVSDAFSAANVGAFLELPAALVFVGCAFAMAGVLPGVAISATLSVVVLVTWLSSRRLRRLELDRARADAALAEASEKDAARLASEAIGRRLVLDSASATDRGLGLAASGLVLIAAVGVGCSFGDEASTNPGVLVAANILAGRALGVLIAGVGSASRMVGAMPARNALAALSR